MFTFGFTTLIDALSWTLVLALGVKFVSTLVILVLNKDMRDQRGWGSALWWATKIAPVATVVCFAAIAILERDKTLAGIALAVGFFVLISVPLKIVQRRSRIADVTSSKSVVDL